MPDDLETTASTSQAGDEDTEVTNSTEKKVDYESKYKGEARRAARLSSQLEALQKQYDEVLAQKEEAESKARTANKSVDKAVKDVQALLDAKTKEWEAVTKELSSMKLLAETRKIVSKDYPKLTELLDVGDLKLQNEFTSPEDYQAYLKRMADRLGAQQSAEESTEEEETELSEEAKAQLAYETQYRHVAGATPSLKTSTRDSKNVRTSKQIETEMFATDTRTPEGRKKFAMLEREQDEALKREGIIAPR